MSKPIQLQKEQRVMRVFVSSTFKDMKEEREILIKRIFPQLRRFCEDRNVIWGEVDLRWGITEEQKAEGMVLPVCLEEIKRCRPYFIGILGERYGWVPDAIPQDLIDREPWLKEHLDHSVTELEILQGVLNNPEMAEHAFFYFRDPEYINHLPKNIIRSDFVSEKETSMTRLLALKEKIEKSGFPVRKNYSDPKVFGEFVLQDFTAVISRLYPAGTEMDPLDREVLAHETYAQSRAQVYIGGQEYFNKLDSHAAGNGPPLVILGESGAGKSALLANWAFHFRDTHPDFFLLMHFIGATPYSADWAFLLRRIMGGLKHRFGIKQDIPEKSEELKKVFIDWLHIISAKFRTIIIIDALNQLEDREGAPDLLWLPIIIPENVRLIVSTLPGRSLDELRKRNWPVIEIQPLITEERKRFINSYLKQYSKALSPSRIEKIAKAGQTANPLFLKILLEELRLFGEHEKLDEKIDHYLVALNTYELYSKVLERWKKDYEDDNDLLNRSMSLIWASRNGLSELELLELLGENGNPLAGAKWSPLFLAARESLLSRMGLLNFSHDYLYRAVKNKYLQTQEQQRTAYIRLADYFEKLEPSRRKMEELPWQLARGGAWQRLYSLLTDLPSLVAVWKTNPFDVKMYWVLLEKQQFQMTKAYDFIINDPQKIVDKKNVWIVANLLKDTGHLNEALSIWQSLAKHYRQKDEHMNLNVSLANQSDILKSRGNLDEAMSVLKEQESISRNLGSTNALSVSLEKQAVILKHLGRLEEAMSLLKETENICRKLEDKAGLVISLGNQANILNAWNKADEALRLHKEVELICRELGDMDGLIISLGNQANILYARDNLSDALKLQKKVEDICREIGNKEGLQRSLGNQGGILNAWDKLETAMSLLREQENICCELDNKEGLSTCLGNQAVIFQRLGRLEEAMSLLKKQEKICDEVGYKTTLAYCLQNQAVILAHKMHNPLEALPLIEKAYNITIQFGLSALAQQIKEEFNIIKEICVSTKSRESDMKTSLPLHPTFMKYSAVPSPLAKGIAFLDSFSEKDLMSYSSEKLLSDLGIGRPQDLLEIAARINVDADQRYQSGAYPDAETFYTLQIKLLVSHLKIQYRFYGDEYSISDLQNNSQSSELLGYLSSAFFNRGNTYDELDTPDSLLRALSDYQNALKYGNAQPWDVYFNMALVYEKMGQNAKAYDSLRKSQKCGPPHTQDRIQRALIRMGKYSITIPQPDLVKVKAKEKEAFPLLDCPRCGTPLSKINIKFMDLISFNGVLILIAGVLSYFSIWLLSVPIALYAIIDLWRSFRKVSYACHRCKQIFVMSKRPSR